MAKYLKAIGIIELIGSIIGVISLIVVCITNKLGFVGFIYVTIVCIFAPALGLLFYSVGELIENSEKSSSKTVHDERNANSSNSSVEIKNQSVQSNTVICKNCLYEFSSKLDKCPYCGTSRIPKITEWDCPHCGHHNESSSTSCENCNVPRGL